MSDDRESWRKPPKRQTSAQERILRHQATDQAAKEAIEQQRKEQADKTARLRALRLASK